MTSFLFGLLTTSLTMSLLGLLLLGLSAGLSGRYHPRALYLLWLFVLMGFLLPFRPQIARPALTVSIPVAQRYARPMPLERRESTLPAGEATLPMGEPTPVYPDTPAPAPTIPSSHPLPSFAWLIALWAAGASCFLGFHLLGHHRFLRMLRRWQRPAPSCLQEALMAEKQAMGIRRQVGIALCPLIDSPMLIGLFRPRILVPDGSLSPDALSLVLRHELTHLRGRDLLGKTIALLARAIHWFNPLLIPFTRELSFHCEAACDGAVLLDAPFPARQAYSRTLLSTIRPKPSLSTAFSTQYYGGFTMMKKRIIRILDLSKKRMGVLLFSGIFAAVLGMGMAFAIDAAQEAPTYDYPDPEFTENYQRPPMGDTDAARIQQLNARLGYLLWPYQDFANFSPAPSAAVFMGDEMPPERYTAYMDAMDALSTAGELQDYFLGADFLTPMVPDLTILDAANALLHDAGYVDIREMAYELRHTPRDVSNFHYQWIITAKAQIAGMDAQVAPSLTLGQDGAFLAFSLRDTEPIRYEPLTDLLSQEERQFAKDVGTAFLSAYLPDADLATLLISDYAFQNNGLPEPYTLLWAFRLEEGAGYQDRHEDNFGYQLALGLSSGAIYQVTDPHIWETLFANQAHAGQDWVERTGLPYPYPDDMFFWDEVQPKLDMQLDRLLAQYEAELSPEEKLIARHMGRDPYQLGPNSQWEAFLTDLENADSLDEFLSILHGEYVGISQSYPGEPTREDILKKAKPLLTALGYGAEDPLSFVYASALSGANAGAAGYEAMGYALSPEGQPYENTVRFAITAEGKVRYVSTALEHGPAIGAITDAERERAKALSLYWLSDWIADGYMPDESTFRVSDTMYQGPEGGRIAPAYIMCRYRLSRLDGTFDEGWTCLIFTMDLVNDRLVGLMQTVDHTSGESFIQNRP